MNQIQKNKLRKYTGMSFLITAALYEFCLIFTGGIPFVEKVYLDTTGGLGFLSPKFIILPLKVPDFVNILIAPLLINYTLRKRYNFIMEQEKNEQIVWILAGFGFGLLTVFFGVLMAFVIVIAMGLILGAFDSVSSTEIIKLSFDDICDIYDGLKARNSYLYAVIGASVICGLFYNFLIGIVISLIALPIVFVLTLLVFMIFSNFIIFLKRISKSGYKISKSWLSIK